MVFIPIQGHVAKHDAISYCFLRRLGKEKEGGDKDSLRIAHNYVVCVLSHCLFFQTCPETGLHFPIG